jgi:eukaryotic-like serine/threonine-protein kinase
MNQPEMIGKYRIGERIAGGGAGEIFAAVDTKVRRDVAIKFLRPEFASDPEWVRRFLAEATSLARLNHPNIATLYDFFQDEDHLCMIMELVRGQTVEKVIEARHRPLGIKESLAILVQAADGLFYAHEQGVIHRDVKPSNLMLTESGRVKIMDFGIARVRGSERMTRAGSAVGTLLYMSPEQCKGLEGDERSDIYSLAVVLYELLAGAPPFKGASDFELTKAHISTPPPPLIPRIPGIEPPLEAAIMTALAKRPDQRFPSMRSLSDAIGASALRGDATGIIHNYVRAAQGQTPAVEIAIRSPFHTVLLAVARSRVATAIRRFRQLHLAVRLGLAGAVVLGAGVAAVLWPEQPASPEPSGPVVGKNGTVIDYQVPSERKPATTVEIGHQQNDEREKLAVAKSDSQSSRLIDQGRIFPDLKNGSSSKSREEVETPTIQSFQTAWDSKNYGQACEIAKKLDAAGDPEGAYGLGLCHYFGLGIDKDKQRGIEELTSAANAGHRLAAFKLGQIFYEDAYLRPYDRDRLARHWFQKAADEGFGEASYNLSAMCHNREGGFKRGCDEEKYYSDAVTHGYTPGK